MRYSVSRKKVWKQTTCLECQKEFDFNPARSFGKFCSTDCFGKNKSKENKEKWLSGEANPDRATIKKYLIEDVGEKCCICDNGATWHGKPLALQLDHQDGDASNHRPENVRLLCPNCHSQTPTWGAKNKGNGRKARGLALR